MSPDEEREADEHERRGLEYDQLLADVTAAGTWSGFEERLDRVYKSSLPAGTELLSPAELLAVRREFLGLVRKAARPYRERGWVATGGRLIRQAPTGYWSDLEFRVRRATTPTDVEIFATISSPYLLRVYEGLDPDRRPASLSGGHVQLLWQVFVTYDVEALDPPSPLPIPIPTTTRDETGIVLGAATASAWLSDAIGRLVEACEGLSSDGAMRDWLLEHRADRRDALRYAALLTRHLGEDDRLSEVLEKTRLVTDALDASLMNRDDPIPARDRGRDPRFWSHKRFLKFLAETRR
jgi:hypothetical protein